ncbi:hypothetical protein [Limnobacter sp.]|uniref:hypothetical protein n=1 Tax=Limnobacter sp. TaxID=2003368 RepID=UPI0035194117
MTIRAPYQVVHTTPYKKYSFEREVFFETLGACWALSARNVSGVFALQLQIDLSRVRLLYGVPSAHLPEALLYQLLNAFQSRPRVGYEVCLQHVETNALALIEDMNEGDFLNFSTGFQDAITQILEPLDCWTQECQQAHLALKYYGLNLVESGMKEAKFKRTYADLLVNYMLCTQRVFLQEAKTTTFYF